MDTYVSICKIVDPDVSSRFVHNAADNGGIVPAHCVKRRGLSTQPWAAPVLTTKAEEVWLPIRTVWGQFVRKSNAQLQSVVLKLKSVKFYNQFFNQL